MSRFIRRLTHILIHKEKDDGIKQKESKNELRESTLGEETINNIKSVHFAKYFR